MATQPSLAETAYTWDGLVGGDYKSRGVILETRAGSVDAEYAVGRLLNIDVDGKYHPISSTETTVALNATGEVVKNNLAAASGTAPIPFVLAHPPIPGTVHLATTADGSATVLKELGTDNGHGMGVGADGSFTIDYETGQGIAYLASAATDTNDLKAGYKYRTVDAADSAETLLGMPKAILMESVTGAAVIAADVKATAAIAGTFVRSKLLGYSAGYEPHLNRLGIFTV